MKDKAISNLIKKESKRQTETLDLIASENFASHDILEALGSPFTNKYSEGYPGKRYYPGNVYCDMVENLARKRALKLFKLNPKKWSVNVQPLSGSPANLAVYFALLEPGDTLMGLKLSSGGHLTHGHKVSITGKHWKAVQYGVDGEGIVDYKEVKRLAHKHKPKIIISGFSAYPRKIDFKKFKAIADEVGAYHMVDMAHIAGLIAGGVYPTPFPYADVVTTTTHKTLRGPRGAMIFSKKELSEKIDKAVFPGLQGGPHNNTTAGIAVALYEAMQRPFKKYAAQIIKNARALAKELKQFGIQLVSGGTDSHLLLLDVRNLGIDGMEAQNRLEKSGIIANRNTVPGDPSPFKPSGVRLGTPSITSRGMKEREMKILAFFIYQALLGRDIKARVVKLCKQFPAKRFLKS
ncbi:MAG: serine hydroxymethyltransferase [Candidatus Colwellbacteria bacterium]|nr:serine hydroxymethyltransferase [Candidatus Colwellbacteria bacterium]